MLGQTLNVAAMVASYTDTARFNSRHSILLAHQLERVAPTKPDKAQRAALALVKARAKEVEEVRKARHVEASREHRELRERVAIQRSGTNGACEVRVHDVEHVRGNLSVDATCDVVDPATGTPTTFVADLRFHDCLRDREVLTYGVVDLAEVLVELARDPEEVAR